MRRGTAVPVGARPVSARTKCCRALVILGMAVLAPACDAATKTEGSGGGRQGHQQSLRENDSLLAGVPAIVSDTVWRFPSGATVPSRMRAAIEYIGRIDGEGGPYLLASGVECNYCDANLSVLLQAVSDTSGFLSRDVPGWYVYPGTIRSLGFDGVVDMESRLFWGECRADRGPGLLQIATEYDTPGRGRRIVRLTEVRSGRLVDDSLGPGGLDTAALRHRVESGRCHEIPPREQ